MTSRFARADAVQVLTASPDRVPPPCPHARPGGCGGCDWQHVSVPAQRKLKGQVISQQLRRIAGLDADVVVEPVPGDVNGLGWRTRVRYSVRPDGTAGLRRHRSHQIADIGDCLIAHPLVSQLEVARRRWPEARSVDVSVAADSGEHAVRVTGSRGRLGGAGSSGNAGGPGGAGGQFLTQRAADRDWRVAAAGFWQVHPGAADAFAAAVLAALEPRAGEHAVDLYSGAGLFAGVLGDAVGPGGAVLAVERDAAAAADARWNLQAMPWVTVEQGDAVAVLTRTGLAGASLAVADPPRAGLEPELITMLSAAALRRIAYVSCDPATLARDVALFGRSGWQLDGLRAFDAFPMTHHVECVAVLGPAGGRRL